MVQIRKVPGMGLRSDLRGWLLVEKFQRDEFDPMAGVWGPEPAKQIPKYRNSWDSVSSPYRGVMAMGHPPLLYLCLKLAFWNLLEIDAKQLQKIQKHKIKNEH